MREHQGFLLFEYQRFKVAFVPMVEIASSEVKGKLFTVVAGNGELSFQLALGCNQLLVAEGLLHQAVQLMTYQSATTVDVVVIAPEVDAPDAGITIGCHRALYRIYQSVSLS